MNAESFKFPCLLRLEITGQLYQEVFLEEPLVANPNSILSIKYAHFINDD